MRKSKLVKHLARLVLGATQPTRRHRDRKKELNRRSCRRWRRSGEE